MTAAQIICVQGGSGCTSTSASSGTTTTNTLTITQANTPTSGDLNILTISIADTAGATVSNIIQTGVTWTHQVTSPTEKNRHTEIWAGPIVSGATTTIVVTLTSAPSAVAIANVCEFSGLATSGFLDQTAGDNGNSAAADSGTTGTTQQAVELLVASIGSGKATQSLPAPGSQGTPSSGWTLYDGETASSHANNANSFVYDVVSSTGTYESEINLSASVAWNGCIATFEAATTTTTTATTSPTQTTTTTSHTSTLTTTSTSATSTLTSSTTTSTSGSTTETIDTIGGTTSNANDESGVVYVFSITASASGTLTSVGLNVESAAGSISIAVYSTLSGTALSGLLGQSASTTAVNGWNDLPISGGISISSGTTYYLAAEVNYPSLYVYGTTGAFNYFSLSYGTFPSSATVTSNAGYGAVSIWNMRMTYGTNTLGTTTQTTPTTSTTTSTTATTLTSTTTSTSATSTLTSSTTTSTTGSTTSTSAQPCSYEIYISGSTIDAKNCATGSIVYSGTDAAAVINYAISALRSSGGSIFIEAGTYIISATVGTSSASNGNVELYGQGNATILEAATNLNSNVIGVSNANGWYVHDLQVNGNRANHGAVNGISFYPDSSNDVVKHTYVHDDLYQGIDLSGTNDKALDNLVVNSNANGMQVYGGSNYLIEDNIINGASDVGISISGISATQGISDVVCEGNTILNVDLGVSPYGVNSGDGIITGDNGIAGGNITVANNYIDVAYVGMWISETQGLIVSGNTIIPTQTGKWDVGIAIGESDDEPTESAIIKSNLISSASIGIYIYSTATSTVQFLDNTITSIASGGAPIVTHSAPVIIEGNVGYNPVGPVSSPLSGSTIVDSGSSNVWTSGTTYTNWESPKALSISGGTVTAIKVNGQALSPTTSTITLQPGDTFSITFSSTPTIKVSGQ